MPKRLVKIGVIGSQEASGDGLGLAEVVGRLVAGRRAVLICGGLGGIMEAAARGAKAAGGLTVGILPGFADSDANPYIDLPLATGLSLARNALVVRASHAIIAIEGEYGTLSEIAFALQLRVPVVGLRSTFRDQKLIQAKTPEEAVEQAFHLLPAWLNTVRG
jgi:uncharacterized protein (TIGR00725 family)